MTTRRPGARTRRSAAGAGEDSGLSPRMIGAGLLALLVFLHVHLLTPYTNSLDDIKAVTMWAGGGLCLLACAVLALHGSLRLPPRAVLAGWCAYLGVLLLSALVATASYAKWSAWQTLAAMGGATGYMLLAASSVGTERLVRWSLRFWVVVGLTTCGFGLLHYAGALEHVLAALEALAGGQPARDSRFYELVLTFASRREMLSTILNSQFFGNFLTFVLPVALASLLVEFAAMRSGEPTRRWAVAAALVAAFAPLCIFWTFSKTAVACVPVVLVGFAIAAHAGTRFKVLRIPAWPWALGLGAVVVATAVYFGRADLQQRLGTFDVSADSRAVIWQGAWTIFREHPLLGAGPGSFRLEFPGVRSPDYHLTAVSNLTLYAHNVVLDLLAETGIAGLLAWLAFVVAAFLVAWRAFRRAASHPMRLAVLGYLLGVGMLLLGGLLTPMIRWPVGLVQLAVGFGLMLGASQTALGEASPAPRRGPFAWAPRTRVCAVLVVLAAVWFAGSVVWSVRFYRGSVANNEGLRRVHYAEEFLPRLVRDPAELAAQQLLMLARAAEDFEESVRLNPTFVTAYYKLGHAYNRMGLVSKTAFRDRLEAASQRGLPSPEELDRLVALLDDSIAAQQRALDAYDRLEGYAPGYAETALNRAIVHMTVADSFERRARLESVAGRPRGPHMQAAREQYRLAVAAMNHAVARSNKINVAMTQALLHERFADALDEDGIEWREQMLAAGHAFRRTRDLPLSVFVQEPGQLEREKADQREAALRAPLLFARAGEWLEAAADCEWLARRYPGNTGYIARAAEYLERAGEVARARQLVDEALGRHPLDGELWLWRVESAAARAERDGSWREAAVEAYALDALVREIPGMLDADQVNRLQQVLRRLHAVRP